MSIRGIVITGAAALAACGVLGIAPPAAQASSAAARGWTVTPGGNIAATSGGILLEDTTIGGPGIVCSSSAAGGLRSGSGLAGTGIGGITALALSGCAGGNLTATTTASPANPWVLNARSYDATTGVTTGTITNIMASFSGTGCSFTVAGPTATTPGAVKVSYTNSTHKLKVKRAGTLHIWNFSGCAGIPWNDGDAAALTGTYKVRPGQTITSP
jgi:hypothetical protein